MCDLGATGSQQSIYTTFTFRAFSRRFYPTRLAISTLVRRKRNNKISLSVTARMFTESAKH